MKKLLIICILSILFNYDAFSTHAAGMDISYQCISQGTNSDTYKITLKFYRDCEGIGAPSSLILSYSSSCGSGSATLYQVGSSVDINPLCASYCNGGSAFGIEEYTYETTVTLTHCSNWVLRVCECCRNNAITTINNPGGAELCVEATLNNTVYCNNSPTFSEYPTPFLCAGNYFCYNNGAIEIDGDSLVYSLITPLDNPGTVTYIGGYSITNPVGGGSTFDPITGNLCVTPPGIVSGVLAIKVSEYRNGILIGSIIRDIQINTFSCTSVNPPQLSGIDTTTIVDMTNINTYTVEVNCPDGSQNINFDINTINNNPPPPPPPPGANITVTVNTQSWGGEISWDITSGGTVVASGGGYSNYSTYTTIVCVPIGPLIFNMYDSYGDGWNGGTYSITGNATLYGITSGGLTGWTSFGSNSFGITGGTPCTPTSGGGALVTMSWNNGIPGANFTIANNNTMNPIGTFSWNPTLADTANSPYFFTVNVTNDACPAPGSFSFQYQVIVTGTDMVATPIITNVSCNGGNDATISISTTGTSPPFSYLWPNGGTTANASYLTAGTYNLQLTDGGGCTMTETYTVIEPSQITSTSTFYDASCLNINDGSATVFPSNGTPGYTYLWNDTNTQTTQTATSLASGTYICTITDSNSCIFMDTVNVGLAPAYNTTISSTNAACNGNTGTAIVSVQAPSAGVSNLTYCTSTPGSNTASTIDNVQLIGDTFNITNNTTGICDQYEDYTNQYADITQGQSYTIDITLGDCSNNYASGGKVYIDWNIDGDFNDPGEEIGTIPVGPPSTTTTIPFTVPFSVFGATRMRIVSQFLNNIPVSNIGPCDVGVMANPIYTQPWFGATEDYSIVVNGGSVNATYLWSNGQTTDSISGLLAGGYSVLVTVPNGCTLTEYITITEPPALSIITSQNNVSCFGGSNGDLTINISGGIPDYTINAAGYSQTLVGGVSSFTTPSLLPAGTYPYTITDSNNCVYTNSITLTSPSQISITEIINNVSCNGGNDGSVNLIISGGIPTYTEDWGSNNSSSLSVGTYPYTVTDNNGCTYTNTVLISEPSVIQISSTQNNVSTCGATDGNIDITTLGGISPYSFSWSSGQNTEDINSLSAGTFILTVTDANLCTSTHSVTLTEPSAPIVAYTQTNTSCNLGTNGSIDVSVSGGLNPYQYSWSNSATSQDISNLSAGIYTLNVTDANNCIVIENITITQPTAVNVISTQTNVTNCNGNDGSIDISVSGGTGSYIYLWSNSTTTEDVFNLTAGIHSLDVTDANNCTFTFSFTITEPSGITATENITNVACFGENSGSVTINVIGGQSPYIENWNGYNPSNLTAGSYSYTVTDNQNCNFTNSVVITEPQELVVTENIINVLCKDENTGSITLNVSGGTIPYNENWGVANPNALFNGTYIYTVTDANGCTFNNQIMISEPDLLISTIATTDAICFGYNDGTAIITTNGGTQPYNTNWFGQNNLSLTFGNYSALITDSNGCTNTLNFSISEPAEISVIIDSFQTTCFGYSDGSALLTISGGFPPFTENWFGQNNLALDAGNHNFEVIDSNNCIHQGIATIYQPLDITTNEITSDVLCNGENNGTAFLQISGGTIPYSENWNGFDITQLPKGNYTYTIIDNNGCTFSDYVIIDEPDILSAQEIIINANCFNSNDGQALLTIIGGTIPYTEDWGGDNPFALSAGVYYYTISDLNSCSFSDSVLINQSNEIFMNFSVESPICIFDTSKATISIINPNYESYTIEINDGTITTNYLVDSLGLLIPLENQITFNPENSRVITVVSITDENGCNSPVNQTDSIIVNPLPILNLDIPNFCTQDTSIILNQAIPAGGIYFIDNKQTNFFDIENMEVETYNVRYEYTNQMTGCFNTISTDIQINESPYADFAFGPQPANIDDPEIDFENKSDFYNYQLWDLGDGTIINQDEFSHIFPDTGSFFTQLYIENEYGCSDSITYEIIIYPVFTINIPSAFTPNDDGDNDTFGPVLRDGGFKSYNMKIYNQWGEIIFDQENTFWDGTLNNELCQHGTYAYTIIVYDFLNKPHSRTGSFILIK